MPKKQKTCKTCDDQFAAIQTHLDNTDANVAHLATALRLMAEGLNKMITDAKETETE